MTRSAGQSYTLQLLTVAGETSTIQSTLRKSVIQSTTITNKLDKILDGFAKGTPMRVILQIQEIHYANFSTGVEVVLKSVVGVRDAAVNISTGQAMVHVDLRPSLENLLIFIASAEYAGTLAAKDQCDRKH